MHSVHRCNRRRRKVVVGAFDIGVGDGVFGVVVVSAAAVLFVVSSTTKSPLILLKKSLLSAINLMLPK
jgi:hypothetical protein